MSILDVLRKKESSEVIHHVVLVEAPMAVVGPQLMAWFDNSWKPSSKLVFKDVSSDKLQIGSKFAGRFKSLWPVKFQLQVTRLTANALISSVVSGFFTGTETISAEERSNVVKVDYTFNYEISNPISLMVWSVFLEDRFTKETRKALEALKIYCEKAR